MKRIEVEVEFVTPCFLGGAEKTSPPDWRGSSIRGQLRWWFRAVAGGAFAGNPATVAAQEKALFGGTDTSSALSVRAIPSTAGHDLHVPAQYGQPVGENELAARWGDPTAAHRLAVAGGGANPVAYLGYGPVDRHGHSDRQPVVTSARIELVIGSRTDTALLPKALWAWINLGGLGAKSRRGFGSLVCTACSEDTADWMPMVNPDIDAFKRVAATMQADSPRRCSPPLPEWSHFSDVSAIFVARIGSPSWQEAMGVVGGWLIAFRRRYGNPGDTRTPAGTPLSRRDYEWAAPNGGSRPRPPGHGASPVPTSGTQIPDRAGFGLPLPFGQGGETVTWRRKPWVRNQHVGDNRRASPLLIHIGRFQVGQQQLYFPVLTHLPARLIPNYGELIFKGIPAVGYPGTTRHHEVVRDFLEDLASPSKRLIEEVVR